MAQAAVDLARRYHFSEDAIAHLDRVYGAEVEEVLKALKRPAERYYFRANRLKLEPAQLAERLRRMGLQVQLDRGVPEALFVHVDGPRTVPSRDKAVVVDKFAAESVLQGAHVYAPGVVNCRKLRVGEVVSVVDEYGQLVGNGIARMDETEILRLRSGLAIEVTEPLYRAPSFRGMKEFEEGLLYPQSLPAMATSLTLDPQPGETIVDIGSSPGGKATHMAALMGNQGTVLAVDRNAEKIERLVETTQRLGAKIIRPVCADGRYLDKDYSFKADRVCIDVSCSSLGVRPKLFEEATSQEIQALAAYQRQFLPVAHRLLKDGGVLVYSTCTLTLEEDEEMVGEALRIGFDLDEAPRMYTLGNSAPFLEGGEVLQRFRPDKDAGPGYFIARLRRR